MQDCKTILEHKRGTRQTVYDEILFTIIINHA